MPYVPREHEIRDVLNTNGPREHEIRDVLKVKNSKENNENKLCSKTNSN